MQGFSLVITKLVWKEAQKERYFETQDKEAWGRKKIQGQEQSSEGRLGSYRKVIMFGRKLKKKDAWKETKEAEGRKIHGQEGRSA